MEQTAQFWHNHKLALIVVNIQTKSFKYLMPLCMQYGEFGDEFGENASQKNFSSSFGNR